MTEEIYLENLNSIGVNVKRQFTQVINNNKESVGLPFRKSYVNDKSGRNEIKKDLPEIYQRVIFSVWGI